MTRRGAILGMGLALALLVAIVGTAHVSGANAPSGYGGHGPWSVVVGHDSNSGYLLNTTTGQVWRLRDDVKVPMREWKPEPGK